MDQDETRHEGRPRRRPHCVRWGRSSPPRKGHSPQFWAHARCAQTAGWIKMPLSMGIGLDPGHIVLDGDLATPQKGGTAAWISGRCLLWPNGRPSQLLLSTCLWLMSVPCVLFSALTLFGDRKSVQLSSKILLWWLSSAWSKPKRTLVEQKLKVIVVSALCDSEFVKASKWNLCCQLWKHVILIICLCCVTIVRN